MIDLMAPGHAPGQPELAVVVISLGAPPALVAAVRSVLDQEVSCEVIVVNSGGGDASGQLSAAGIEVPVFESHERLYAGAARNVGIRQTVAPFVAFLACDCLAAPGWAAERLRLHRRGESMVASAVMPYPSHRIVPWAHHLLLFPLRLPGLSAAEALLYGVSFERRLFDDFGVFDGTLPTGEDTEFLDRIAAGPTPMWAPKVVTCHRNATSLTALMRDQAVRGYRYGRAMRRLRGVRPLGLAKQALRQPRRSAELAERGLGGRDLELARRSRPWVRLGCLAKAFGILATVLTPAGSQDKADGTRG